MMLHSSCTSEAPEKTIHLSHFMPGCWELMRRMPEQLSRPEVSLLSTLAMMTGIVLLTRESSLLCLLLMLPIALLSWYHGRMMGITLAVIISLLVSPLFNEHLQVTVPLLDIRIWGALSGCYLALATLVGLQGALSRSCPRRRFDEMQQQLANAQASAERYQVLLEQMTHGQQLLHRMNEELALLNSIATMVNSSLEISNLHVTAMTHIASLLDVDDVQLAAFDPQHGDFHLLAAHPMTDDERGKCPPMPADAGILLQVGMSEHTVTSHDRSRDLAWKPPSMLSEVKSVAAVPLRAQERLIGVLMLGRINGRIYSTDEQRLLESIGRILAVAVENASLFREAKELSFSDELTGLANRRMFNVRLGAEMNRVRASNSIPLCLAIFDLDFFKRVNDQYGHPAGDEVLREFAKRIQADIRGSDLFCRIGGEEFALLVPDTGLETTVMVIERICRKIARTPFTLETGTRLPMTVSAGVAQYDASMANQDLFINAADEALYQAKSLGRNRVEVYIPASEPR